MNADLPHVTLRDYPQQRSNVIAQRVLEEMVLFDAEKEKGFSLNKSARSIWDLCDGRHTISEICTALATALSVEADLLHDDVLKAIQQFAAMDLVIVGEAGAVA